MKRTATGKSRNSLVRKLAVDGAAQGITLWRSAHFVHIDIQNELIVKQALP
jgi:hypothetical protein